MVFDHNLICFAVYLSHTHRYPDVTPEQLRNYSDTICIICREEMTAPEGAEPNNQQIKKLPCDHIFHKSCLRSWFQRQQTCPTCRTSILRFNQPATPAAAQAGPAQPAHQVHQQAHGYANNNQPPASGASSSSAAAAASSSQSQQIPSTSQSSSATFTFPPLSSSQIPLLSPSLGTGIPGLPLPPFGSLLTLSLFS
jgi:E3 ubiquitin-protein ligase synoviolin